MTIDLDNIRLSDISSEIEGSGPCVFFLDYDGTLCPFFDDPEEAILPKNVSDILERMASNSLYTVFIVSGRSCDFLERTFRNLPVSLIAEHGAATRLYRYSWRRRDSPNTWREDVRSMVQQMVLDNSDSWMEEKEYSICWHYRKMKQVEGVQKAEELIRRFSQQSHLSSIRVLSNDKNVEFKYGTWNKGTACMDVLARGTYQNIVAIGDDVTDEDMFRSLPASAYTVKVGEGKTNARFRAKDISHVLTVLDFLTVHEKIEGFNTV